MKNGLKWVGVAAAAALVVAPLSPASARGWDHGGWHRGGPGIGLIAGLVGLGAAVGYAATTVATAPFVAVGNAVAPAPVYAQPAYYPQPVYAQPVYAAPAYYPAPGYYGYRQARYAYAYPGY